jgi:hypothetical protein
MPPTGIPKTQSWTQRSARPSKACIQMAYIDRSCLRLRGAAETANPRQFLLFESHHNQSVRKIEHVASCLLKPSKPAPDADLPLTVS